MFDIKNPKTLKWFEFSEDESYLLRPLSEKELNEFVEVQSKYEELTESKGNQREIEVNYNRLLMMIIGCVEEWQGITAGNKKIECNEENKKIVFNNLGNDSAIRLVFVMKIVIDVNNFFDFNKHLKN